MTWLPAWRLREMIVRREVSSAEVVDHFLGRIEDLDSKLHAFRQLDPVGAKAQAQMADKAVRVKNALGPLHGVPIALKEILAVKGFPLPWGAQTSSSEGTPLSERDDVEVGRLRATGAIILGTTVSAGGVVPGILDFDHLPRNPWDTSRTPGASSAGNGAAVAGGLIPMAIGGDGGGSIRVPSAFCGLVGLHPTRGLIPHVDYESATPRLTKTIGPMTRNVRDAAIALQALAGPDGRDFVCLQDDPPNYSAELETGVKGIRFLWTDNFGFAVMPAPLRSPQVIGTARAACSVLGHQGGVISTIPVEWENPLTAWLITDSKITSGTLLDRSDRQKSFSKEEMQETLRVRQKNWDIFRGVFKEHDFVLSPTVQFIAPKLKDWVEMYKQQADGQQLPAAVEWFGAHTMMCNLLGLPAISIPAGFVDGLPVGLQVIGRPRSEAQLLKIAYALLGSKDQK